MTSSRQPDAQEPGSETPEVDVCPAPAGAVYERALAALQGHLHALTDGAFEAIILSESGLCLDHNRAATELFGYSPGEVHGKHITVVLAAGDRATMVRNLKDQGEEAYEVTAQRRDGSTFPCEVRGHTFRYADHLLRVTGMRDLTLRSAALDAHHRSEERNQALLAAIPDLMLVVDRTGTFLDYSQSEGNGPLVPPASFLGRHIEAVVGPAIADEAMQVIGDILATGSPRTLEYSLREDGDLHTFEARGARYSEDHVVFLVRDVTETRRLRLYEQRTERLETAGRVASQVAHDFNNLLAPLTAYPDLIRDDLTPGHPAMEMIDVMEDAALQIAEINQQLLTLGRRGHYTQHPINLNGIIERLIATLSPLPPMIHIDTELATDLMNVLGGPAQIARALTNLLVNALDALGGAGTVAVVTENCYVDEGTTVFGHVPVGEYVKITVRDTGTGIADEDVDRIFEPFFTTKMAERSRGSGLGLAVVRSVLDDHGAHIDLVTSLGRGTSFFVYIPITRKQGPTFEREVPPGSQETVLVVDDDSIQRQVAVRILTRAGYVVDAVDSGEKAVELLARETRDLVLLDMIMPGGINGTETYRRILDLHPEQRALVVSGYSDSDEVRAARALGILRFVRKPVTVETLCGAVSASFRP